MSDSDRTEGWQAQLLRVTLFTLQPLSASGGIWREITGRDPDIDENRVRESLRRQAGAYENGELEVQVSPIRIDVMQGPNPEKVAETPWFGPAQTEIGTFINLVKQWVERIRVQVPVSRIAFGGVVLLSAKDRSESYRELSRLLSDVRIDAINTKELIYRINRPKVGPNGLEMNRITTWHPLAMRHVLIPLPGGGQVVTALAEHHFVRLEFDNSTPAERADALESDMVVSILDALAAMALENMQNGERP